MQRAFLVLGIMLAACSGSEGGDVAPVDQEIDASSDTGTTSSDDSGTASETAVDTGAPSEVSVDTGTPKTDTGPVSCKDDLKAKGLEFTDTEARGVVEAIHVTGKINGVLFANGTSDKPMGDPVACAFAQTLWNFAELLKSKGFVRVGTLGSYCYRCCCAWSTTNFCRSLTDPEPMCGTSGYSNHSWGRAVDVRYLYKADGTMYDINDPKQFVKWATTETCTKGLPAQTGISKELYQLACDATATKVFGTVLTPNYNADHRNHFHMDIGEKGTPTSWVTKSFTADGIDDATCGDE
ncbi:MAG: extensin family protein [Polyangiales bacterium]